MLRPLLVLEALLLTLTTLTSCDIIPLEATDAVVVGHLFPACNGQRARKSLNVPVDRCLSSPNLALEIKSAATCANGTRAQWARFPEKGCGDGILDVEFGLVELEDKDIGTCLDVMKIGSMAFWCDGVKKSSPNDRDDERKPEEEDKTKDGSVSESACMVRKAPFWNHPKADTCVNLQSERMQVTSAAVCANGTLSTLALYKGIGCPGAPSEFRAVEAESRKCLDVEGMKSYAFYCTGEGIERGRSGEPGRSGGQSGGIMQFLLVLTLIIMMFFLMLVLSVFAWVRKYGGSAGKLIEVLKNLFKPKEGSISI